MISLLNKINFNADSYKQAVKAESCEHGYRVDVKPSKTIFLSDDTFIKLFENNSEKQTTNLAISVKGKILNLNDTTDSSNIFDPQTSSFSLTKGNPVSINELGSFKLVSVKDNQQKPDERLSTLCFVPNSNFEVTNENIRKWE